ncbi:hypothetical protein VXO74_06395 [Acinetobacter junii]|uniref:hypothetical protein n=1 Tax=Acinetobacter junii TaxID=40215 RepID=UPI003A87AAAD
MSRFYIVFFLLLTIQPTYAEITSENFCKVDQTYKLSIFSKSDAKFISKNCELSPENQYIESFLIIKNEKNYINKIEGRVGNGGGVELIAVSLYKKNSKPPVLITLYSETYCCYPQPSGKLYTVDLYEIKKESNHVVLNSITNILGRDNSGLEGVSDDYMHFKFKDIASIKKWLDRNHK